MTRKTRPYREALLEALADPVEAAHYLNAAKADSPEMFRKACLNVIQARQVTKIAREAGVTRESLYRSFSSAGNPAMETVDSVLEALDIEYRFFPKTVSAPAAQSGPATADEARAEGRVVYAAGISLGFASVGAIETPYAPTTGGVSPSLTWQRVGADAPRSFNAQELNANPPLLPGFICSHKSGSYRSIESREDE